MSDESRKSTSMRWFATSIVITLLIAALSVVTGFVWLPVAERDSPFRSVWDAFCSSVGLVRKSPVSVVSNPNYKTSTVVVSAGMARAASATP